MTGELKPNEDRDIWQEAGKCRGMDPDVFAADVLPDDHPRKEADIALAKAACAGCVSKVPCLEFAVLTKQDGMIWGGYTTEERRDMTLPVVRS